MSIKEKGFAPVRSHTGIKTIEYIQNRINTKTDKIVYLGGYIDDKHKIYLMCNDCGYLFARSSRVLRPSKNKNIQCDKCLQILSEVKEKERQQSIESEKKEYEEIQIQIFIDKEKYLNELLICHKCGKSYKRKDGRLCYCSSSCAKRMANHRKENERRIKIKEALVNKDITLDKLAIRDNNICWICNKKVNKKDCEWRDNSFVAGQNYPSIDHVIPLSKGGEHSWDNVRLAHMKCNTNKGNRNTIVGDDSQVRFVF